MEYNYQTPRYLIVIDQIKAKITDGELEQGERLPSETDFAKQLRVSRNTLREALRILEEENIIVRKHGVGTFVNKMPVFSGGIEELFSITDMIEREDKIPGTEVLFTGFVEPHSDDIKELNLKEDEQVLLVKRVRTANGSPLVYCIDKIPADLLVKGYKLKEESMLTSLQKDAGITISYAKADIKTIGYHEDISDILKCGKDTPLLILKQIHFDLNDRPVLYSLNFFRSDQISFSVLRKRVN
ncbi:GntR family transcriptional regulator [Aquibacillus koreensis]|uniref:GntR family transcriptional regulator n=1 Tax=Aquibacillus koreensis TaxID=279446 RepID=A0A9X3WR27_9BACI|nr:GntR family transcriptional regulator [Aquibacillus koreensis]MCT2534482.1 GntR family transcriptional regulator [Aquibacillus koreensis]MDC3421789.1 GntR family transcriptional regulator [Aquibacillus koreensis]